MSERIYMDYNASTPPAPGVAEAITQFLNVSWGNPSSAHAEGRRARAQREQAREAVARSLDAQPEEVVFTSGGSEADALALRGLVEAGLVRSLVLGGLEHPAVLATARWLERHGTPVRLLAVDRDGRVDPQQLPEVLLGLDRPLVSVMLAQNEIGALNDLPAICRLARAAGALVHSDAVAAYGKVPLSFRELGIDLLSVSAHKIGGPAGVGALVIREQLKPAAYCHGGTQELGRRPGTEALPLIVGFGFASGLVPSRLEAAARTEARRERLEQLLCARIEGVVIAARGARRLPNTIAAIFRDVSGSDLVTAADARGLSISAGAACHSAAGSPTMTALALPEEYGRGLVRISMSPTVTQAQVDQAGEILVAAVSMLRQVGSR
jgi:cysteine desulfurase